MKVALPAIHHNQAGFETLVRLYVQTKDCFLEDIEINMAVVNWFDADMCAAFGAIFYDLGSRANTIQLTNIRANVEKILLKNGFLSTYGRKRIPDTWGATIPYQRFDVKDDRYFARYIETELIRRSEMPIMSPGLLKKFRESVFEIFSNSVIHSRTKLGIFSCGQYFPKRQRLDFSVADLGIGIRKNVKKNVGLDLAAEVSHPRYHYPTNYSGLSLTAMKAQTGRNRSQVHLVKLILLFFLSLAAIYSVTTPLFEGFDEHWHFAYVQHIKTGQGLPRQPPEQYPHLARQEGSQPPLYYLTVAALTWWIPTDDFTTYLQRNPKWGGIPWDYVDNLNYMLHSDTEQFPYRGTVLAVHIARWLSAICGVGVVYNAYRLAQLLFPQQRKLALAAMSLVALTPSFAFVAGLCSNDSMNALWASLTLVLLARLWRQPTYKLNALLGLVLGLAALTKLSGLALWGLTGLVLLLITWRQRNFNYLWRATALTFLLALLVSGWWYLRNLHFYEELTGVNMMLTVYERRSATFNLRDLYAELEKIRWSYWAIFGWFNVPVKQWMYHVYDLLTLLGGVGVLYTLWQTLRQRCWLKFQKFTYLLLWAGVMFTSLLRWAWITTGSHGRLLHPAISAISILLVQGWVTLIPRRDWKYKIILTGVGAFLWGSSLYVPLVVIPAAYAPPRPLTPAQVAAQTTQQTEIHFEDKLTLLGYAVQPISAAPGEITWVTACWRGDRSMQENYFVFIHLRTPDDIIISQKDTYHGLGNFPTSIWPDGIIFCDRYPLKIPATLPLSNPSTISLGVYHATGERLIRQNSAPEQTDVQFPGPQLVKDTAQEMDYNWNHQLGLVRYDLTQTTVTPGEALSITLYWNALTAPAANYVASIQVLDENYNKIAQSDIQLMHQQRPTSAWQASERLTDQRQLQISPEAQPGVYSIKVIVYETPSLETLSLYKGQQLAGEQPLTLCKIRLLSE